jgi:hypothetical protein
MRKKEGSEVGKVRLKRDGRQRRDMRFQVSEDRGQRVEKSYNY